MIITSGVLARDMNLKQVMVKGAPKFVLNNCIFIKGKGEKDIPVNISAWGSWAEYIANNYKKGDTIHIIGDETPEIFKCGDSKIDILGVVVKAVVEAQISQAANEFFRVLAYGLSSQHKTVTQVEDTPVAHDDQ